MTEKEARLFHKNYEYMWSKLHTTHYYVTNEAAAQKAGKSSSVVGGSYLPSYAICSKCMRPDYEPSTQTVNKIVDFYNKNLTPPVDTWAFLHDDLSLTDAQRSSGSNPVDPRFIGTYYGYYFSSARPGRVHGAILKIYAENYKLKSVLVQGLHTDQGLFHEELLRLMQKTPPTQRQFDQYYKAQPLENRRSHYLEGEVEITEKSLLILFRSNDPQPIKLCFALNITNVRPNRQGKYLGGLAYLLSTAENAFGGRFYQMGILNSELPPYSMDDPKIASLLELNSTKQDVLQTAKADWEWYDLALNASR